MWLYPWILRQQASLKDTGTSGPGSHQGYPWKRRMALHTVTRVTRDSISDVTQQTT